MAVWSTWAGRAAPAPVSTAAVTTRPPGAVRCGRSPADRTSYRWSTLRPVSREEDGGGGQRPHAHDLAASPEPGHHVADGRAEAHQAQIEAELLRGGGEPTAVHEERGVVDPLRGGADGLDDADRDQVGQPGGRDRVDDERPAGLQQA